MKPPKLTGAREEEPSVKEQDQPEKEGQPPGPTHAKKTQSQSEAGDPARRPGAKPTRRRESLHHDRGLRKNTVPT